MCRADQQSDAHGSVGRARLRGRRTLRNGLLDPLDRPQAPLSDPSTPKTRGSSKIPTGFHSPAGGRAPDFTVALEREDCEGWSGPEGEPFGPFIIRLNHTQRAALQRHEGYRPRRLPTQCPVGPTTQEVRPGSAVGTHPGVHRQLANFRPTPNLGTVSPTVPVSHCAELVLSLDLVTRNRVAAESVVSSG